MRSKLSHSGFEPAMPFVLLGAFCIAFSCPALAYTEQTLHAFCSEKNCKDGSNSAGVTIDALGNVYGVASAGGKFGAGLVYEFSPNTAQYTVLYNFCRKLDCADGAAPNRVKLVIDASGDLYGTTQLGGSKLRGGVVFELSPGTPRWHEKVLYTFCQHDTCEDGGSPLDGLTYAGAAGGQIYDGNSPLFGTTYGGGATEKGTVFSVTPDVGTKKWAHTVLYAFCPQQSCADGLNPDTPLYFDAGGNLYGTTEGGGQFNEGVVFEVSPNGSNYSEAVLYNFCAQSNCNDGSSPLSGVVMDHAGNLIGAAGGGGAHGDGAVFELSPNGTQWQYSVLDNFSGSNGSGPINLMIDSNGKVFGTTYSGGTTNNGTVFEFDGSIQSLYSFCPAQHCTDGKHPIANLAEDASGNLYGTTIQSRRAAGGSLFKLSQSGKL